MDSIKDTTLVQKRQRNLCANKTCHYLPKIFFNRRSTLVLIVLCFLYCISIFVVDFYWKFYDWMISQEAIFFTLNSNSFDFTNSSNITGFPYNIVPNIVHYVRFDQPFVTFVEMLCIRSVLMNLKPDKIVIHYNVPLTGKYWNMIRNVSLIETIYCRKPLRIFGQPINVIQHASDVARLQILRKFGGIYLDNDVVILKSLNQYRKYEFTIGWNDGDYMGNQILICHKDARFLKLYYNSYRDFVDDFWYWNAGEGPTRNILWKQPFLVHRVKDIFGNSILAKDLYVFSNMSWQKYEAMHLLISHKFYLIPNDSVKVFDEFNIISYKPSFGKLARFLYYGNETLSP